MPTTDVAHPVNLQTPRVVKCPTPQCPGWITLDSTRHQTDPCRYCRIGVDTLRFLLSRVGAENKALPSQVHDEFNRLMLTMAGTWGQNVYLRPSNDTLVDLKAGTRSFTVEYNPLLGDAGSDGPTPLVGIILHGLLHSEAHIGSALPQPSLKSGSRDKQGLLNYLSYMVVVADHAWVSARLEQINPLLRSTQSRWGLDLAQMLIGRESLFNPYLSERNLSKLIAVLRGAKEAEAFKAAVIDRLATVTRQTIEHKNEETRRIYLAIQLVNVRLMNPGAYQAYQEALLKWEIAEVREASTLADRVYNNLINSPIATPPTSQAKDGDASHAVKMDPAQYHRAIEASIKALGAANYFEVKS